MVSRPMITVVLWADAALVFAALIATDRWDLVAFGCITFICGWWWANGQSPSSRR